MTSVNSISDEQLNAFLDDELLESEREQIITALANNAELKARYEELKKVKSMLRFAYQDVPQPKHPANMEAGTSTQYKTSAALAAVLIFGIAIGWSVTSLLSTPTNDQIQAIRQFQEKFDKKIIVPDDKPEKILLHIGSADSERVNNVLHVAEDLLQKSSAEHRKLTLEVVANSDGLAMLRKNSPYAQKIAALSREYNNVHFLACGIAKKTAALKEGRPIELIPQADDIPAALEEILKRLKEGWTYVRG